MSHFYQDRWFGKAGMFLGKLLNLIWVSPDENEEITLNTPTHVYLNSSLALDSATLSVNSQSPISMITLPVNDLRIAIAGQSNAVGGGIDPGRLPITGIVYDEAISGDPAGWPGNIIERLGLSEISIRSNDAHGVEFGIVQTLQSFGYSVASVAKYAVSGSSLSDLAVSPCWQVSANELYIGMRDWLLLRQSEYGAPIDIFVWHQGESDAQLQGKADVYDANLHALTTQLRIDLGNPNLIVVVPRLNITLAGDYVATVRAQQALWQNRNPVLNRLIDVDSVPLNPLDFTHYLSAGHDEVGRLLAVRASKTAEVLWTPDTENSNTTLNVIANAGNITETTSRPVNIVEILPTDIANLELWWQRNAGISSTPGNPGDPVDSWTDAISGVVLSATTTARPVVAVGGGITVVDANDCLRSTGLDLSLFRWMHSEATYFFVMDRDDEGATLRILNTDTNVNTQIGISIYGSGLGRIGASVHNGTATASYALSSDQAAMPLDTTTRVLCIAFDGVSMQLYVDSLLKGTQNIAAALATGTNASAQINAINTAARMTRTERDVLAYSRKLTLEEITAVTTYLTNL